MRLHLFCVYDQVAGLFNAPFVAPNGAVAQRMIEANATDPSSLFSSHPDDFQIFEVGELCNEPGLLIPNATPRLISKAVHIREVLNG